MSTVELRVCCLCLYIISPEAGPLEEEEEEEEEELLRRFILRHSSLAALSSCQFRFEDFGEHEHATAVAASDAQCLVQIRCENPRL